MFVKVSCQAAKSQITCFKNIQDKTKNFARRFIGAA
jgi:hypothetical protein